jgi:hypothetical protein
VASAENNRAQGGPSPHVGAGSCTAPCVLAPLFSTLADKVSYQVTGISGSLTIEAQDDCLPDDVWSVSVRLPQGRERRAVGTAFTNGGTVGACTCPPSAPSDALVALGASVGGTAEVRVKAVSIVAGFPASPLISFSDGTVTQTQGVDSCF